MKKIGLGVFVASVLFANSAWAGSCVVTVYNSDGSYSKGDRVVGSVSWGGMTKKFYTDRYGKATVTWSSNNSLSKVFVNGRNYGSCRNGRGISVYL